LFNGESFGYIGSSRIVYEMMNDSFPYPLRQGMDSKNDKFSGLLIVVAKLAANINISLLILF